MVESINEMAIIIKAVGIMIVEQSWSKKLSVPLVMRFNVMMKFGWNIVANARPGVALLMLVPLVGVKTICLINISYFERARILCVSNFLNFAIFSNGRE